MSACSGDNIRGPSYEVRARRAVFMDAYLPCMGKQEAPEHHLNSCTPAYPKGASRNFVTLAGGRGRGLVRMMRYRLVGMPARMRSHSMAWCMHFLKLTLSPGWCLLSFICVLSWLITWKLPRIVEGRARRFESFGSLASAFVIMLGSL